MLQRKISDSNWTALNSFKFEQVQWDWNHQASAYYWGFIKSFAVNVFGG